MQIFHDAKSLHPELPGKSDLRHLRQHLVEAAFAAVFAAPVSDLFHIQIAGFLNNDDIPRVNEVLIPRPAQLLDNDVFRSGHVGFFL